MLSSWNILRPSSAIDGLNSSRKLCTYISFTRTANASSSGIYKIHSNIRLTSSIFIYSMSSLLILLNKWTLHLHSVHITHYTQTSAYISNTKTSCTAEADLPASAASQQWMHCLGSNRLLCRAVNRPTNNEQS